MEPDVNGFSQTQLTTGAVVIIVLIIGAALYYWSTMSPVTPEPALSDIELEAIQAEEGDVIVDIAASAEKATLKDEIPTVETVSNPVEGMYKNPFE